MLRLHHWLWSLHYCIFLADWPACADWWNHGHLQLCADWYGAGYAGDFRFYVSRSGGSHIQLSHTLVVYQVLCTVNSDIISNCMSLRLHDITELN